MPGSRRRVADRGQSHLADHRRRRKPSQMLLPVRGDELPPVEIGAIYTIGLNYRDPANPDAPGPARPLVYGKARTSLAMGNSPITWDRSLTQNVNGECELGV